jgi:ribosomal protein S1
MIQPGSIVEAKIYRCEQYGVYLRHDSVEIFVHLPDLLWTGTAQGPADSRGLLDTIARVKILRWNPEKNHWIGSIKKAHPELNPFIEISKNETGCSATIWMRGGDDQDESR